jgi:hypothetical protein
MAVIENIRRFLWAFVELAFLTVLAVILTFLILGDNSGVFVKSVIDNVMKFAGGVPTPSLIGLAALSAMVYLIVNRLK